MIYFLLYTAGILGNQTSSALLTYRVPLGVDASFIQCTWSHDGKPITIDGNKYVRSGARSLQIRNIVGDDEGIYTCNYNYNQQARAEAVANLCVIGELHLPN